MNLKQTFAAALLIGVVSVPAQAQVTGMSLWLKADSGISLDPSSRVTGWADQSGNAHNAANVIANNMRGAAKPEIRDLLQHLALAGNGIGQDHIESAEPIGRDDQQVVVIDGVDVAHLATMKQRQRAHSGLKDSSGDSGQARVP